ncbi:unnamed protein product, partial [Ectocarpus sp. 4 AP-2014]
ARRTFASPATDYCCLSLEKVSTTFALPFVCFGRCTSIATISRGMTTLNREIGWRLRSNRSSVDQGPSHGRRMRGGLIMRHAYPRDYSTGFSFTPGDTTHATGFRNILVGRRDAPERG